MTSEYTKKEWDALLDKLYNLPALTHLPELTDPPATGTAAQVNTINMAIQTARFAIAHNFRQAPETNPIVVVQREHPRMLRAIQLATEQARYSTIGNTEEEEEEF